MNEAMQSSTRDRLTRKYATDEIVVVEWEPRLRFHSQSCVRSLPQVVDESRRPCVKVDAASADEVEAAVALCPSGALRTRRVGTDTSFRRHRSRAMIGCFDGALGEGSDRLPRGADPSIPAGDQRGCRFDSRRRTMETVGKWLVVVAVVLAIVGGGR